MNPLDNNQYKVELCTTLSELEPFQSQWNTLASDTVHKSPIMSFEWMYTYFECREEQVLSWAVFMAFSDDRLVGVLPIISEKIKKLGISCQALSLPYSSETMSVDMLTEDEPSNIIISQLIQAALKHYPRSQYLHFKRVDKRSKLFENYKSLFSTEEFIENGASLDNDIDYTARRSSLPKNFKSNLNKANNKAKKLGEVEFVYADDELSVEEQLRLVIDVEHASWKGEKGSAIACSDQNIKFYENLVQRLNQMGWLAIHYLKVNNVVVAANLGIRFNSSLLLWKLGYRDEFKKLSPGGLLMEKLLQHIDQDKSLNRVDLMTNESWYNNWNMHWRPFYDVYIFKKSPLGIYLFILQKIKTIVKRVVKR